MPSAAAARKERDTLGSLLIPSNRQSELSLDNFFLGRLGGGEPSQRWPGCARCRLLRVKISNDDWSFLHTESLGVKRWEWGELLIE